MVPVVEIRPATAEEIGAWRERRRKPFKTQPTPDPLTDRVQKMIEQSEDGVVTLFVERGKSRRPWDEARRVVNKLRWGLGERGVIIQSAILDCPENDDMARIIIGERQLPLEPTERER